MVGAASSGIVVVRRGSGEGDEGMRVKSQARIVEHQSTRSRVSELE